MNALFRPLLRQSLNSSGIYLLFIALTMAISATAALKFSNVQIQQAVALQAAEMLAGDAAVIDNSPIDQTWKDQAAALQLKQSEVTLFGSMAHTGSHFVMVNVKAVDGAFPLRGELKASPHRPLRMGEVWLSQRAMDLLHIQLGDSLQIADGVFKAAAIIEHDSNQELGFSGFSPTVIISQRDIAKTHAVQTGSRIEYRLLLAGAPQQVQQFEQHFNALEHPKQAGKTADQQPGAESVADAQSSLKLRTASDSNTRLMKPIANLDTFLQLANILTILLCGIAIALSAQRYVQQNQDHIALLRCMGASSASIWRAYAALLGWVMLGAILAGTACGMIMGAALLKFMLQLAPQLALQFSVGAILTGPLPVAVLTSTAVLCGFVLPSLYQLLRTAPNRVIRQPPRSAQSMLWMLLSGAFSLMLFCLLLTESWALTLWVLGAITLLCVSLYAAVWALLHLLRRTKSRLSAYVRTPYQSAFQITALALGLSLVAVLAVLRSDLLERWQQQLPAGTPNQFVYGLPPFEVQEFQRQLTLRGWKGTPLYPNIRGRLVAKNEQPFSDQLLRSNPSLRRELNLTQASAFPADNKITQGALHFSGAHEVSVEAKTAAELGIQLGDRLTFSLPEGMMQAKVINLRSVEWESFSPNFFFIFSPQSMDANAGSYLGSFYVPPAQKHLLIGMIQQFSNTVFIDVSLILDEVKRIIGLLVQIVSLLAALVALSGLLVLTACLNLLMDERKREAALLRAFGSSKQKLKRMLSIEVGLMGLIAGIAACIFAEIISAVASYKMELMIQPHAEIWLILPLSMTMLCALIGYWRLSYLCDIAPLQSLREMNQ